MHFESYLFFEGRCEEAIEFYRKALGAEVKMLVRFKDSPEPPQGNPPGDKIMHARLQIGDTGMLVSDGHCQGQKANFQGFSLAITVQDEAEAKRVFGALSEKGQVRMPLGKTFFSPMFGMLADQFGVGWMVLVKN